MGNTMTTFKFPGKLWGLLEADSFYLVDGHEILDDYSISEMGGVYPILQDIYCCYYPEEG